MRQRTLGEWVMLALHNVGWYIFLLLFLGFTITREWGAMTIFMGNAGVDTKVTYFGVTEFALIGWTIYHTKLARTYQQVGISLIMIIVSAIAVLIGVVLDMILNLVSSGVYAPSSWLIDIFVAGFIVAVIVQALALVAVTLFSPTILQRWNTVATPEHLSTALQVLPTGERVVSEDHPYHTALPPLPRQSLPAPIKNRGFPFARKNVAEDVPSVQKNAATKKSHISARLQGTRNDVDIYGDDDNDNFFDDEDEQGNVTADLEVEPLQITREQHPLSLQRGATTTPLGHSVVPFPKGLPPASPRQRQTDPLRGKGSQNIVPQAAQQTKQPPVQPPATSEQFPTNWS